VLADTMRLKSHTEALFRTLGLAMSVTLCAIGFLNPETNITYAETRNHLKVIRNITIAKVAGHLAMRMRNGYC
jgi:hypothetical protein